MGRLVTERPCTYLAEAAARRREAARQGTATYEQRMWRASMAIITGATVAAIWLAVVLYVLFHDDGGPWRIA